MHESKQKQANSKSQVYSQAREEQEAEESFLHQEHSLVQQLSGSGNLPDASFQAQMLSRIPGSQIAANPELMLQMQEQFGNSHVSQVVQMTKGTCGSILQQPVIQAKLTIGAAGDKYEQEADRVASEVVKKIHAPEHRLSKNEETLQPKLMVQGKADGKMTASPEIVSSIQGARGSGKDLADDIREPMEQVFGADLSVVKVHTDSNADRLNKSIQARAFTTGKDVFFRQGEYNPGSRDGQELIAHELTHVVQQSGQTRITTGQTITNRNILRRSPEKDGDNFQDSVYPELKLKRRTDMDEEYGGPCYEVLTGEHEGALVSYQDNEYYLVEEELDDNGSWPQLNVGLYSGQELPNWTEREYYLTDDSEDLIVDISEIDYEGVGNLTETKTDSILERIAANRDLPPIKVEPKADGKYKLRDGLNRLKASEELEYPKIPIKIIS